MAKQPNITTVSSGFYSTAALNANFDSIKVNFDNFVSRDGSTPNTMLADFDMNNNDILNAGSITADSLSVNGVNLVDASAVPNWRGSWVTATVYAKDDLASNSGSTYICLVGHTSGTFSTDLPAGKWELFASQGSSGAGSGDLLSTNNLSDLSNSDTALANLGGGGVGINIFKDTTASAVRAEIGTVIGADVQAYDPQLAALAGLSPAANKVPYFTGLTSASLLDLKDEDTMGSNSATAVATQQSIKAYVDTEVASVSSSSIVYPTDGTGELLYSENSYNFISGSVSSYIDTGFVYLFPFELKWKLSQAVQEFVFRQSTNTVASNPTCRLSIYERTGSTTAGARLAYTNSFTWTSGGGWTKRALISSWTPSSAGSYWIALQVDSDDVRAFRYSNQTVAVTTQAAGLAPVDNYMLKSTASPAGWSVGSVPPASAASTTFSVESGNAPGFVLKT